MKKIYLFMAVISAAFFTSCDGGKVKQLEAERDSLLVAQQAQQIILDDMYGTLGEFSLTLDSIVANDDLLVFRNPENGALLTKDQIRLNLNSYKKMLEDSRAKIADLEMKMQGRTAELSKLQGLIRFMESELAKKEETINQLLEELDKKNANIAQLSRNVQELSIAKDSLIDEVKSTQKSLAEAKVVYYLVADKKKLESLGIYKAGNITRKASLDFQNLNPTGFTKAKPEAMEIPISGKKPTVMTGHPASSYELRSNSKTEHVLVITDPTNFWSNSKFLVVRIE